jgi:SAM-dependent methyltransferase
MREMSEVRRSAKEQARTGDLMALVLPGLSNALDVGARDGYLSRLLAERVSEVVALDLEEPQFRFDRVACVKGDVTALQFDDRAFDLVLCAEVLEHVPALDRAAAELARVTRRYLVVGVPYRQDIRVGRTTCSCGAKNPPWGHVNSFDESRLSGLFPGLRVARKSFVGSSRATTNGLAAALMDFAGNPFGTYEQDEPCVKCGQRIPPPPGRSLAQKAATRAALYLQRAQTALTRPHGNWIHLLLEREAP